MHTLLLAARLALAMVFIVSAVAKLADRRRLRTAMSEFRIPSVLARPQACCFRPSN